MYFFLSQTSNVVQMILYELSRNPDVQQTLHDEVTGVVPQGELPSAAHLQNMPYLKAVVKETLRCASRIYIPFLNNYIVTGSILLVLFFKCT